MRLPQNLTDRRFKLLVAIRSVGRNHLNRTVWECKCDCGNTVLVSDNALLRNNTRSCGCLKIKMIGDSRRTHGRSRSPEYRNWCAMKERCYSESHKNHGLYGGRGIQVCDRWVNSFENFLADMGKRPFPRATVERVDGNGNYSPENCVWATQEKQTHNKSNNRILEYAGQARCLAEWAKDFGIPQGRLWKRLKRGWPIAGALTKSPQPITGRRK